MTIKVLGGGTIDGLLGHVTDWSIVQAELNKQLWSVTSDGLLASWVVETSQAEGGQLLNNGYYANPIGIQTISTLTKEDLELGNVDNTADLDKPVSTETQSAIDDIDKGSVGLDNVDNTSDLDKPISTLTQTELSKIKILALAGL